MLTAYYPYLHFNDSPTVLKQRALNWANKFRVVAYYESNQIAYPFQGYENILAVTQAADPLINPARAFPDLQIALQESPTWLCGFLSYDLKNQLETLSSRHVDNLNFPEAFFFVPEILILFGEKGFTVMSARHNIPALLDEIQNTPDPQQLTPNLVRIEHRTTRAQYIQTVKAIQQAILEGEVYELNYCVEFFDPQALIDPLNTFIKLNATSPTPFAGYFKYADRYLLCASPERFLKKEGDTLISQPIKGTIRRGAYPAEDAQLRDQLRTSEKEMAENMMIMDLVRNDLARSSVVGTVKVAEMFGIYGFRHLYQMITTVTSRLRPGCPAPTAIANAFPVGSMTGAPKIRAMELIDIYENFRRGLFAGSMGYFKPNGDFDFNVIIRSLQYNARTCYLSYMVGSAITYDSDPEQEYEECLLKAKAITDILQG